jgi:hypothetical protein
VAANCKKVELRLDAASTRAIIEGSADDSTSKSAGRIVLKRWREEKSRIFDRSENFGIEFEALLKTPKQEAFPVKAASKAGKQRNLPGGQELKKPARIRGSADHSKPSKTKAQSRSGC